MGHVFSDDSYYSQLAISFLDGTYPQNFSGYLIFLARKLVTVVTAAGFSIFGENEIGSVAFPFIFSILSIGLIYGIAEEIFNKNIALAAAFILAIFPVDIIFASLNFPDLIAAFFINFGIYYLIRYLKYNELKDSVFAGVYFSVSFFGKINFYFIPVLLMILFLYKFRETKKIDNGIIVSLLIPAVLIIFEALIYGSQNGDYFYRFNLLGESSKSGSTGVLNQILSANIGGIFLRSIYLFIPVIALIQSILLILSRSQKGIVFWYLGFVIYFAAFSTSFTSYRPLDLKFAWHLFPVFFPAIILTASFIYRFSFKTRALFLIVLFLTSIVVTSELQNYFGVEQKNELKNFIKENSSKIIYTDHQTKYGIDLIDGYPKLSRAKGITNLEMSISNIPPQSFIIYNPDVTNELMKQGHKFSLFSELYSEKFKLVDVIGGYEIYTKLN